jgi:hypothetical protein
LCATCLFLRVTDLGESHSSTSGTPRSRLPVQNIDKYTTLEKESMTINLMSSLCLDVAKLISVNVNVYLCIHSCAHIYFVYNDNIVVIVVSINTEWV